MKKLSAGKTPTQFYALKNLLVVYAHVHLNYMVYFYDSHAEWKGLLPDLFPWRDSSSYTLILQKSMENTP